MYIGRAITIKVLFSEGPHVPLNPRIGSIWCYVRNRTTIAISEIGCGNLVASRVKAQMTIVQDASCEWFLAV